MDKDNIISLIWEDLKHNQLLNGLYALGLTDNDKYVLKLDIFIAQQMGCVPLSDEWMNKYQNTMLSVTPNQTQEELECLAVELYTDLQVLI